MNQIKAKGFDQFEKHALRGCEGEADCILYQRKQKEVIEKILRHYGLWIACPGEALAKTGATAARVGFGKLYCDSGIRMPIIL